MKKELHYFKGQEIRRGDVLFYIGKGKVELWEVRGVGRKRIDFAGRSILWPCFYREYQDVFFWTAREARDRLGAPLASL